MALDNQRIACLLTILLFPIVLLLTSTELQAQRLSILNIETRNFPEVTGDLIAIDGSGEPITGLSKGNLSIFENGLFRNVLSLSCPPSLGPTPVSMAFVIDRSGSMLSPLPNGSTPLDLIIDGSAAFFETFLFTPPTGVAITAFNERPFIVSDFQTSAPPLLSAIQGLTPEGGTDFDPAFVDPMLGGISLLKSRPQTLRRILMFITDGEPGVPPNVENIISEANKAKVEVYAITIGTPMSPQLSTIATRTNGKTWQNVRTSEELSAILQSIALISRGTEPCKVVWQSETECGPEAELRKVQVSLNPPGISGSGSYKVPTGELILLEPSEKFLWFGKVFFPSTRTQEMTITARNGAITVERAFITDSVHFTIFNWGGTPPPFTLNDGESRKITVQFAPTDTTGYSAELKIVGAPCSSRSVILAGGDRQPSAERAPLKLRSPLGGENYGTCDSVSITWGGVPPDEPVRIQYSKDNGRNWFTIITDATGYEYNWLPPGPGTEYRIKISTAAEQQHLISTIAGGGDLDEDSIFATETILRSTMGLDIRDDTLFIAEAGRSRIRGVDLISGVVNTLVGTGLNGNGGDGGPATSGRMNSPQDVLVTDDSIFIADTYNHKIRVVDRRTNRIYTYAGTGASGFSPDGTHMNSDTAYMSFPASLEIDDRYLYVSESGSEVDSTHRVRRIDRQTKIITTVAGGGKSFDSDGAQATVARLMSPHGIALRDSILFIAERDAGRVKRVDLRTGIITTFAGNGRIGDRGDGGQATAAMLQLPTDIAIYGDTLFIADALNNKIRLVNMTTGIISTFAGTGLAGYGGDGGVPWMATMDSPSGVIVRGDILYVSDRLNNRIRAITLYRADGLDSTATPFSVTAPEMKISPLIFERRVDMGEVGIGGVKDSIVTALVCNVGDGQLVIDSVTITGKEESSFRIVGGITPDPIPPGECRTITLEFEPNTIGLHQASAIFHAACALPDTLALVGMGSAGCDVVAKESFDFGDKPFGASAVDTLLEFSLCNNSGVPIGGAVSLLSPDGAFQVVEGSGPYTLSPGSCLKVKVRYTPVSTGLSMGAIDYGLPITCGKQQTILSGRTLTPPLLDALPVDLGMASCPDDALDTTLTIFNRGGTPLEITDIQLTVNNEGFSLITPAPTPLSPLVIPPGESKGIAIQLRGTSAGTKQGELQITSNDPSGPFSLALTGKRDSIRLAAEDIFLTIRREPTASYPRDTFMLVENTGDQQMQVTGGRLSGADRAFFQVPTTQFPVDVPAGSSSQILVQLLQPTEDRPYRATINLDFEPTCNLPNIEVEVVHAGTAPLLAASPLNFPTLLCSTPEFVDSSIVIRNEGGNTLQIDGIAIVNDPENNFSHSGTTPILLDPGASTTIPIQFSPKSSGAKSATLQLQTNTAIGMEEISIRGEKQEISFTLSRSSVQFDPSASSPNDQQITLTNRGSAPITWSTPSSVGAYRVVSIIPPITPVGATSELTIRYTGPPSGSPSESIAVSEISCGIAQNLQLNADDASGLISVWLPEDSALFNTTVSLPLRYQLEGGKLPDDQDTFTTTIRFIGTTFFFEELSEGEVIAKEWDPLLSELSLTIRGQFGNRQGDTLTSLIGTGLLADKTNTPLTIDQFFWSRPSIETNPHDGSFAVLGTCLDVGLHLISRIPVLDRLSPNPASTDVIAEFSLDDWAWLEATLITPRGETIQVLSPSNVEAGVHQLLIDTSDLPPGLYLLRITTPHGVAERGVVVVK
ncbi:MAG: choice-of-anchor D domain-containing protein [Ignavibacteriae bacterium]|nr:choice-of-anchor D domain-containing protein [Ignavibacteriota bacterium]MCB9216579.1 choice-of-anchor D domain-containing protein [Ignavibacteria bacterium]